MTLTIGSHGTIKTIVDREIFVKGLDVVIKRLQPIIIVVYGTAPDYIFEKYRQIGIHIVCFKSELGNDMTSLKEVV